MKSTCCDHCGRVILNSGSLTHHQKSCLLNPERIRYSVKEGRKGQRAWNKGLTKETSESVAKSAAALRGRVKPPMKQKTKAKLREAALRNKSGGKVEGTSRCKSGWYNGIWCDSSWELAFVLFTQRQGKPLERCSETRSYTHEGRVRTYHPDFLVEGEIIEIKGREDEFWFSKKRDNPDITVYGAEEMKPILKEIIRTYGRNFTDLYDGKSYRDLRAERKALRAQRERALIQEQIKAIEGVDFRKSCWAEEVAKILGFSRRRAKSFVKKHLPLETFPYRGEGERNNQFGTMWVTNGSKNGNLKIKQGEEIPEGYRPGRVCK